MKTLDVNDPLVFDKWRELYHELTSEEQSAFYNALEVRFPHQQSFTLSNFQRFFNGESGHVLEVGGWKGELANHFVGNGLMWTNIELCQNAIDKTVPKHLNYMVVKPIEYNWFNMFKHGGIYSHFVSAHMIEHITDSQLQDMLNMIKGIKRVILEAPISNNENNWKGYFGTHILKMGWDQIDEIMKGYRYKVTVYNQHCHVYEV